jgi:hypothetical protein
MPSNTSFLSDLFDRSRDDIPQRTRTSFLPEPPVKQALSCDSTGVDVKFEGPQGRVICPPHCQKGLVGAYGATVHPLRSAVCLAGIVDGVIPVYGGEMMVTKVRGLPAYAGKDVGYAASSAMVDQPGDAFTMYPVDNIDIGRSLPAEKVLSCLDTFHGLALTKPGEFKAVHCPGDCGEGGILSGTGTYTPASSVCRAAQHAAAIGSEGGHAVVVRGHAQPFFFGTSSGIAGASTDSYGTDASYTVSLPVPDVLARLRKKDPVPFKGHTEVEEAEDARQYHPELYEAKEEAMLSPASTVLLSFPLYGTRSRRQQQKFDGFL